MRSAAHDLAIVAGPRLTWAPDRALMLRRGRNIELANRQLALVEDLYHPHAGTVGLRSSAAAILRRCSSTHEPRATADSSPCRVPPRRGTAGQATLSVPNRTFACLTTIR